MSTRPALPEDRVSRNRSLSDPSTWKPTSMASIQESGNVITCSCGAAKVHPREKVRGDWAEKHIEKRHQGRGIWL